MASRPPGISPAIYISPLQWSRGWTNRWTSSKRCYGCCVNSKQTVVFSQQDKVVLKVLRQKGSLSKLPNRNWSVSFSNKWQKKIDHTVNEAVVLENLNFQWCNLNVNKIDVVVYFSKLKFLSLLICFRVYMFKILAKSDKFLKSYSNLFGGPLFIRTQCT